ncbi:universal stress protein family protein [Chitinophaga skermanii]|uniref:Universal stress protein family protein n=1 Tax=Chitinophaga skermanii TaxID=331697 RepID=A0A327QW58_9BACT|nr:universal stress protein [Chitinophaga skermanii]RAJ08600.1 universal stress protein family protein [Chitinophaga skermanii]
MEQRPMNVLIGIDLSGMDSVLASYLGDLAQWMPLSKLVFLHNVKLSELPPSLKTPSKLTTILQKIKDHIQQTLTNSGVAHTQSQVIVTVEDYSEIAFTQQAKHHAIDLVLLGNKIDMEGSGGLSHKLVRMLHIPVLLVPETVEGRPMRIMEAVDFSKFTPSVVQWGEMIRGYNAQHQGFVCEPVYVSKMNYHFFPVFQGADVDVSVQKDAVEKKKRWQQQYPKLPALQVVEASETSVATALLQYAKQHRYDVIIMGVQGVTSLTTLFAGSVANEMLQKEVQVCLLFVKVK